MILLKDKDSISNWLICHHINKYTLIEDSHYGFVINAHESINLSLCNIKSLPVKFNIAEGDFICLFSGMHSLEGCPIEVHGNFTCSENFLQNLKGAPQKVHGSFNCDTNSIASLEGVSQYIGGHFNCYMNPLEKLDYFPQFVRGKVILPYIGALKIYQDKSFFDIRTMLDKSILEHSVNSQFNNTSSSVKKTIKI